MSHSLCHTRSHRGSSFTTRPADDPCCDHIKDTVVNEGVARITTLQQTCLDGELTLALPDILSAAVDLSMTVCVVKCQYISIQGQHQNSTLCGLNLNTARLNIYVYICMTSVVCECEVALFCRTRSVIWHQIQDGDRLALSLGASERGWQQ
jgi:hypothetical protein